MGFDLKETGFKAHSFRDADQPPEITKTQKKTGDITFNICVFFGSSADACILLLQSGFVQYTAESAAAALHVLKKLGCCLTWLDWTGPSISVTKPMFSLLLMCFAGFYNFLLFMSAQVFVSALNLLKICLHTKCHSTALIRAINAPKVPFERLWTHLHFLIKYTF